MNLTVKLDFAVGLLKTFGRLYTNVPVLYSDLMDFSLMILSQNCLTLPVILSQSLYTRGE